MTTGVYNEFGSGRVDPNAKPDMPGSAEDLANGRQAVAEIAIRVINAGHPNRVAPSDLTDKAAAATRDSGDNVLRRDMHEGELNVTTGQKLVYMPDQLGSVRDVLDGTTGVLLDAYDYAPYGSNDRTYGNAPVDYRFAGLLLHPASGLNLGTYRALDGVTGRFINRDPIGILGGINLYRYVSSAPTRFVDPLGLDKTYFGGDGRSPWDPRNGNWGGENWSGGWAPSQHNGEDGHLPPTDSADECYMKHDKCYENPMACGRNGKRQCDIDLVLCLWALSDDPREWPHPPTPGTEPDSARFRSLALFWFF